MPTPLDLVFAAHLSPESLRLAQEMVRAPTPPLYAMSVMQARAAYAGGIGLLDVPYEPLLRMRALHIPTRSGWDMPARLWAPRMPGDGAPLPVLLFFHGGGYVLGSPAIYEGVCRAISKAGGFAVLAPDYRLAPEWRFPTAVHDAIDALEWLAHGGAAQLGLDGGRIAVGGDSAGGTLAAVCALHARDVGLPLVLQVLIYPSTAGSVPAALAPFTSRQVFANSPVLDARSLHWCFQHYIDEADSTDWRFAPLRADVRGVAPVWMALAQCDMLHDDGAAYAAKLRAARVRVQVKEYPGTLHGFLNMGGKLAAARRLQRSIGTALRRAFGLPKSVGKNTSKGTRKRTATVGIPWVFDASRLILPVIKWKI